ncbi:MAG: hypothetical protein AVDCRST_MAG18-4919 [uncultured Thermomicrobiales bacterium]|uniref:Colicin V production protein n=1 Tax=uncultured Thermomicrobiales bacterium TaxID=1645740 RepID=A0A6N3IPG0_9BACT|nr:MAG: hypothetical protein AVDCRST_MAG18-4919 [uncultured Thermomicrobiales bacterium]
MTNLFDLLIMALFGGTVLLSFLGGLGKVFSTLVGIYGGMLLAAWFYQPFTSVVLARFFPQMTEFTGHLTAFLLLLFLASLAIAIGLGRNYALTQLARRTGILNNLTGGALGVVVAIFATILATMVTSLLLQLVNATAALGSSPTVAVLQVELTNSTLVPLFLKVAPAIILPLMPFLHQGLPPLLAPGGF